MKTQKDESSTHAEKRCQWFVRIEELGKKGQKLVLTRYSENVFLEQKEKILWTNLQYATYAWKSVHVPTQFLQETKHETLFILSYPDFTQGDML